MEPQILKFSDRSGAICKSNDLVALEKCAGSCPSHDSVVVLNDGFEAMSGCECCKAQPRSYIEVFATCVFGSLQYPVTVSVGVDIACSCMKCSQDATAMTP